MSETSAAAEASVAAFGSKVTLTDGATSAASFFMGVLSYSTKELD